MKDATAAREADGRAVGERALATRPDCENTSQAPAGAGPPLTFGRRLRVVSVHGAGIDTAPGHRSRRLRLRADWVSPGAAGGPRRAVVRSRRVAQGRSYPFEIAGPDHDVRDAAPAAAERDTAGERAFASYARAARAISPRGLADQRDG